MPDAPTPPFPEQGGAEPIARPETLLVRPPPYRPFPVAQLPKPIRGFVVLSAESCHAAPAFVALPMLASLASAVGNSRQVEIKPDWHEPSTLWVMTIAKSGTGKTPTLYKATRFCSSQDRKANAETEERRKDYEAAEAIHARDLMHWRRLKKSVEPPPKKPNPPPESRHVINETTIEAVAALLGDNPRGLLLVRDELSGWFGSFGQYKSGGGSADEAHWLELHGAGELRVDRRGKGKSFYVPRASVCITGGIQPVIAQKSLTDDRIASGLAARFLLAMPPDAPQLWSDTCVPGELTEQVQNVFNQLYSMTGKSMSGDSGMTPETVPLSPEARAAFIEFHERMRHQQSDLDDALRASWSKLISMSARLALILHCVQDAVCPSWPPIRPIEESTMLASIRVMEWCANENRRVYTAFRQSEGAKLRHDFEEYAQRHGGRITVREAMLFRPKAFPTADATKAFFKEMESQGWGHLVRTTPGPSGGRPSDMFVVSDYADKTDKTPTEGGSVGSVEESGESSDGASE